MAAPVVSGPSLQRRLLWPLLVLWLAMALVAAIAVVDLIRRTTEKSFDRGLQDTAGALAAQIRWGLGGAQLRLLPQASSVLSFDSTDEVRFKVVTNEGVLVAGEADVPVPRDLSVSLERPQLFNASYRERPARGVAISVASPRLDATATVVVIETTLKRQGVVREAGLAIAIPALLFGAISVAFLIYDIRRGLAPVDRLAESLERRNSRDLTPLPMGEVPAEVQPLLARFNDMLTNIRSAMEAQRRLVADAAHQLRTPVAGIKVLADDLARTETTPASRPVVEALARSAGRMARLTQQLLALARSGSSQLEGEIEFDVAQAVREATEPLVRLALDAGKDVTLDAPPGPLRLRGHPILIGEAAANLLDNAIRYGGSHIRISLAGFESAVLIEVEDDGPGIALEDRQRIFEPFWRGIGRGAQSSSPRSDTAPAATPGEEGTGLGLAVVLDIVLRHRGDIELDSRPEFAGTRIRLRLPRWTE